MSAAAATRIGEPNRVTNSRRETVPHASLNDALTAMLVSGTLDPREAAERLFECTEPEMMLEWVREDVLSLLTDRAMKLRRELRADVLHGQNGAKRKSREILRRVVHSVPRTAVAQIDARWATPAPFSVAAYIELTVSDLDSIDRQIDARIDNFESVKARHEAMRALAREHGTDSLRTLAEKGVSFPV